MGTSTDGQICFGVLLEEGAELPWDDHDGEDDWWLEQSGFTPSFYPYTPEGEYADGVDRDDPRVGQYHAEKRVFREEHPMPIEIVNVCSADFPIWMLAVPGTLTSCRRGYPEKLDPATAMPTVDASPLVEFCKKHGIEHEEPPAWYLSSYWG